LVEIIVDDKIYRREDVGPDKPPIHPHARVLYDYWLHKRADRAYPAWRDIDLLDIWKIAPCLIIKDVIDGGKDFRNRYWGTQVAARAGFDGTGRTHLDLYKNQPLGPQMKSYQAVVDSRCPNTVYRSSTFIAGREFIVYNSLNLPLGDSDRQVDQIIIVIDYA